MNTLKIKKEIGKLIFRTYSNTVDIAYHKLNSVMPYVLSMMLPVCLVAIVKDIGVIAQFVSYTI